jgi:hypothetical protein
VNKWKGGLSLTNLVKCQHKFIDRLLIIAQVVLVHSRLVMLALVGIMRIILTFVSGEGAFAIQIDTGE